MKLKQYLLSSFLVSCLTLAQEEPDRQSISGIYFFAKITAKVISENDEAIPDANVNLRFSHIEKYKDGYNDFHGKSDKNGLYTGESECTAIIKVVASKEGYYPSEKGYQPSSWQEPLEYGDKLQPWNPTIPVMIKKIGKPIPMIVRLMGGGMSRISPNPEEEIGFDMVEYDWVAPHGKGKVEDFRIRFIPDFPDEQKDKSTAKLRFVNPDDGLIPIPELTGEESKLRFPRTAPEKGYGTKNLDLLNHFGQYPDKQPIGYFLRIRTVRNKVTGEITSAQYGKIVDPVEKERNPFEVEIYFNEDKNVPGASIRYSSYINPTPNDRNLEYDQKTNLAPEWNEGDFIAPP